MIEIRNELTELELKVYELLQRVRSFSKCADKQVAACSVYNGRIQSIAYNQPTSTCMKACNTSKSCAQHAETQLARVMDCDVYVSLFPCEPCQEYLYTQGAKRIFAFSSPHKKYAGLNNITILPDLAAILLNFNGETKQKQVTAGELAELIVELMNSERKDSRAIDVEDEYIDVVLQLHCLERMYRTNIPRWHTKYNKLIKKFISLQEEV